MGGLLALASWIVAAVIFFLLAIEEVTWNPNWGYFFFVLGFVIGGLAGAAAFAQSRRGQ